MTRLEKLVTMYQHALADMQMSILMTRLGTVSDDLMDSSTPTVREHETTVEIVDMDCVHTKINA